VDSGERRLAAVIHLHPHRRAGQVDQPSRHRTGPGDDHELVILLLAALALPSIIAASTVLSMKLASDRSHTIRGPPAKASPIAPRTASAVDKSWSPDYGHHPHMLTAAIHLHPIPDHLSSSAKKRLTRTGRKLRSLEASTFVKI